MRRLLKKEGFFLLEQFKEACKQALNTNQDTKNCSHALNQRRSNFFGLCMVVSILGALAILLLVNQM
jgi:hypothetical protein